MNIFKKTLKGMKSFSLFDYALYEITIFVAALLAAKYYPILLSLDRWIYAIVLAVGITHILDKIYKL